MAACADRRFAGGLIGIRRAPCYTAPVRPSASCRTGGNGFAVENVDAPTVRGFGREWSRFDQSGLSDLESRAIFDQYFRVFPWASLPSNAVGFDLGCGSGRWAKLVAPRVGSLHCIDASAEALEVARHNLVGTVNTVFHHASVAAIPLADGSVGFGYSLGVLH